MLNYIMVPAFETLIHQLDLPVEHDHCSTDFDVLQSQSFQSVKLNSYLFTSTVRYQLVHLV